MNELEASAGDLSYDTPGVLRLEGKDVLALLHNISTQSLTDLAPGEARATLFCDFRGRLLHRAAVARTRDGGVWLARPDAPGEDLAAHLERHVFREDVRIADVSGGSDVTAGVDAAAPAGRVIETAEGMTLTLGGARALEIRPRGSGAPRVSFPESERVALGWPRHGHEIRDEFNAFEVNLGGDVSLDKGCYTGQEALMRLVTYRSVRRRLVMLSGQGQPVAPSDVRDPAGEKIGRLTTIARAKGHHDESWVGLAVLRIASAFEGAEVRVDAAEQVTLERVFPFSSPLGRPFQP